MARNFSSSVLINLYHDIHKNVIKIWIFIIAFDKMFIDTVEINVFHFWYFCWKLVKKHYISFVLPISIWTKWSSAALLSSASWLFWLLQWKNDLAHHPETFLHQSQKLFVFFSGAAFLQQTFFIVINISFYNRLFFQIWTPGLWECYCRTAMPSCNISQLKSVFTYLCK